MSWDDTDGWRHVDVCEDCEHSVVCSNPACTERVCPCCLVARLDDDADR